jgi:hypothetical protein
MIKRIKWKSSATETIIYLVYTSQLSMQLQRLCNIPVRSLTNHLLTQDCLIKVKICITIMTSLRAQTQENYILH